jgi:uncharacterized protein (TIGR00251 family)
MKISAKVKPQAREDRIEKIGVNEFAIWVKAKAAEGKANQAVIKILSEYFNMPQSKIVILKGGKSRNKVIAIA